ncbi:MAG TPA: glycosyltransferase family 39 protein [Patescibacteria group bacterium]|nr:glycosyltransferase family 39 protein [Patescibacteria group bacterium]
MKIFKNSKLILVGVLIIAFILRIYQIDKVPVSLFGDELDLGYQAYSILHTGKDYYGNSWPLQFHSIAEYRTPLYLYSAVPTVAIFGISPLGVRLPAVIFGLLGIWALYLLTKELTKREDLALVAAAVLTFSPWDLQYSRAGFEVTELLFFLIIGLYFFFKAINGKGKYLWISVICFIICPWIYSTAKLFIPILFVFLFVVYFKEIFKLNRKYIIYTIIAGLLMGLPLTYSILKTPQRFDYISVFSDSTMQGNIGTLRERDLAMGESSFVAKIFENKFTYLGKEVLEHYGQTLSADFFFNQGDPNLRQSPTGMGEFYKIEAVSMIAGIVLFFALYKDKKAKLLIGFWVVVGVLPSALTRDGGNHATRLILILPPLTFLIAYGIVEGIKLFKGNYKKLALIFYVGGFLLCFAMYIHNYYVHYPWDSEIWWHAGYQEAITDVKNLQKNYKTVVISTANEPPWIFFAAWYPYPPADWQKNFPIGNDVELKGFGKVSHIDKFYFGTPEDSGIYNIGKDLSPQTLYLADAKESNVDFIKEPNRVPKDLVLLKAIAYPSGEPAFYIFTGK